MPELDEVKAAEAAAKKAAPKRTPARRQRYLQRTPGTIGAAPKLPTAEPEKPLHEVVGAWHTDGATLVRVHNAKRVGGVVGLDSYSAEHFEVVLVEGALYFRKRKGGDRHIYRADAVHFLVDLG